MQKPFETEKFLTNECLACECGDLGEKTCLICYKSIHLTKYCSTLLDTEKGQLRICLQCETSGTAFAILASRDEEGWKYPEEIKKGGLYLGGHPEKIKDSQTWKKHTKLPVIKNGNHPLLQPVRVKKGYTVTVTNTCSFDSLAQLILVATVDNSTFQKRVSIYISILHILYRVS